ncbi:MAG: hypothetical protein QXU69_09620, partial [Thermofilaceae archaeon]
TIDVNGLTGSLVVGRKSEETQEGPAPEASIVSVIPWLIILVVVIVIIALALVLRRKRAA